MNGGRKPWCDPDLSANDEVREIVQRCPTGAVGDQGDAASEAGGKLEIRFAKNGPVLVGGNLSIKASSGRDAWHGKRAALCRCGASENKPFCDGTHKKVGFQTG